MKTVQNNEEIALINEKRNEKSIKERTDYVVDITPNKDLVICTLNSGTVTGAYFIHIKYNEGKGEISSARPYCQTPNNQNIADFVDDDRTSLGVLLFEGNITKDNIESVLSAVTEHPMHKGRIKIAKDFDFKAKYN